MEEPIEAPPEARKAKGEESDEERDVDQPPRRAWRQVPTRPSTNRRPVWGRGASGGPLTYSQPGALPLWVDSLLAHESVAAVGTVLGTRLFDSTRGFPGEGPPDPTPTPWFLEDASIQSLRDRKRHRAGARIATPHTPPDGTTSTVHGSTALLRVAARSKRRPSHPPGSRVSPEEESRFPNTRAQGTLSPGTGVFHTAGAAGFFDPSPSRTDRSVAAAGLHKTFRWVARDGSGILRRSFVKSARMGITQPRMPISSVFKRIF